MTRAVAAGPAPCELVAATAKVWAVPAARPLRLKVRPVAASEWLVPSTLSRYPVTAAPPLLTGGSQRTVALVPVADEVNDVGVVGAPTGDAVTAELVAEVPVALAAVTA